MRLESLGVAGIHFYNKAGVVLSLELNQYSICLTDDKGNGGNLGSVYSIDGIEINMLPARHTSTKNVKFDKRKIYLVTERNEFSVFNEDWLYIPESIVKAELIGEFIARQNDNETDYKNVYKLTGSFSVEHERHEILPGDYVIPQGNKRTGRDETGYYERRLKHGTEEPIVVHRWNEYADGVTEIYLAPGPYSRIEYTEKRKLEQKLAEEFNEVLGSSSHISVYQIERLLKAFNITKK